MSIDYKRYFIFFTTEWGFKNGGINSFNFDFCIALANCIGNGRKVIVVSLNKTETSQSDRARDANITLFSLYYEAKERFEIPDIKSIKNFFKQQNIQDSVVFVGHDIFTGEIANVLKNEYTDSMSVVFHHMNFESYYGIKGKVSPTEFKNKFKEQHDVLNGADIVFGIGPKLFESASEKTFKKQKQLIPGLQSIETHKKASDRIRAITFGRYDLKTDKLKQMRLAAESYVELLKNPPFELKSDSYLKVVGISSLSESEDFLQKASVHSDRYPNIIPLPYTERREDLFEILDQSNIALVLSVHEGFGLTGFEAIAAEVPLILTENSGLYQFLLTELKGKHPSQFGIYPIKIKGHLDNDVNPWDKQNVVNALSNVYRHHRVFYAGIKKLKKQLSKKYSWDKTAREFLKLLGLSSDSNGLVPELSIVKSEDILNAGKKREPYIAHPYSIIKNFTGRTSELQELTDWLSNDNEPLCVVDAIGGMGKSSLCAKWLNTCITKEGLDGVIWWSFYDQGIEDFIHNVYEYTVPENIQSGVERKDELTEVLKILSTGKFLVVMDGFERMLRGYAQMRSMYIQEDMLFADKAKRGDLDYDVYQATPIAPKAEKFLRGLSSVSSKILITTRLFPSTLRGSGGIKHLKLMGLSQADTIAFFKGENIKGTDEEMLLAGDIFGFHPLMLSLLSSAIKRRFKRNITRTIFSAFESIINKDQPQKILNTSYNLLSVEEQKVASILSVFRTAFTFDAAKALFPNSSLAKLEEIMMELFNLNFILYNEEYELFDFHPILRSFLYDILTDKNAIHSLAVDYFARVQKKETTASISDIFPIIEKYHHLIGAKKYHDAYRLFVDRLTEPLFHQLSLYQNCIYLWRELFIGNSNDLPALSENTDHDHSYIYNMLGLCYTYVGQLSKAKEMLFKSLDIYFSFNNDEYIGIVLKNLAEEVNIPSGDLTLAMIHLTKSATLVKETNTLAEMHSFRALVNVLTLKSNSLDHNNVYFEGSDLTKILQYCADKLQSNKDTNDVGLASRIALDYTKALIAQIDCGNQSAFIYRQTLDAACKTMQLAETFRVLHFPSLSYIMNGYEAISRTLISLISSNTGLLPRDAERIIFYDENYQSIKQSILIEESNYLTLAERCVHEGLTISRKTNKIYNECVFLYLLGRVEWLVTKQLTLDQFVEVEKIIIEAILVAEKIGYRILLSDLHLFCAEILIDFKQQNIPSRKEILSSSISQHIEKARRYAKDTSTMEQLYWPTGEKSFYNDIAGFHLLRQGYTEEEKISNGYFSAWLRAEALERRELEGK